ncbi:MAG: NAD-dependent epimerase/dehydratase family protein [Actinobacteria bacterium]|nr:MAG: NAD-dependent epimerase/dehydratase family protein [Actinomycetota bacterium]
MLVLVTGGAGFVGSHVVDALLDAGHAVRCLDVLHPAAHAGAPPYLRSEAEWMAADLRDPQRATRAVIGVDAVCHQAAMVGLGSDITDVSDYVDHNLMGTANLLRALAERSFAGRLVLASSMVVYGEGRYRCPAHGELTPGPRRRVDLEAGRFDPPCPRCGRGLEPVAVTEDAATDPRNVYAATKLAQEHLCAAFAREREDVALTALRYHNVYGPRMPRDTPYAGVASIFRSDLEAGHPPQVFEDGAQLRDFVHVADVARANLIALARPEPARGVFNVASGRPRTVGDMAQTLARAFGTAARAPEITGRFRLGDVRHVFANADRGRRRLGFAARVSFEAGIAEFARAPLREARSS